MAEFVEQSYADEHYSSNGKANAGLTLGIIGTALSALNSGILGNGSGILGLGGGSGSTAAAVTGATALGMAASNGMDRMWQLEKQEATDQSNDLYLIQEAKIDALKALATIREKDVTEKSDIYRLLKGNVDSVKDYATTGMVDLYKTQATADKELRTIVDTNRYESMKNLGDVFAASQRADKDLEIQIEKNRETDQAEKFALYKDLSDKTNSLAYETLKQSYEDRIAAQNQTSLLAARVAQLETQVAVNSATDPLYYQLGQARTAAALNTKVTGQVTVNPTQICGPMYPPPPYPVTTGCSGSSSSLI